MMDMRPKKWTFFVMAATFAGCCAGTRLFAETNDRVDNSRDQLEPRRGDRAAPQANPLFALAHRDLLKKARAGRIDVYFLGDSITRRWHANDYPAFQENWKKNFFGWNAANFGWGGDRTENVLWRLAHGELDGVHPKVIVLLVGTNNVGESPRADDDALVDDTVSDIAAILKTLQEKAPNAKIILMGITPQNAGGATAAMPIINRINDRLAKLADGKTIRYLNINDKLADPQGRLHDGVTVDGLHLSTAGYQVWADALTPILTEWLGPRANVDTAPPPTGIPLMSESDATTK
jgi:lysophospholipase L1-like esterase